MGIAVLDRPGVRSEEPLCHRTDPGSSVESADRPGTPAGRPAARPASRRRCGCPGRFAWMRGPAMSLPHPGGQVRQRGCRDQPRRGPGLGGRAACGVRVAAVVVDGAVHGRAGLHHRQRGAAVDPAGPARRHDDAAVGDQRLRGGVRRVLAAGWAARRRLRPGQAVPDRAGRVHPGEHLRGPGRRAGAADHFPGGAGDRRGYAGARGPVPAGHQLAWGKGTRPRALGTYGAIVSAGFASGAVLGGLLVEITWRLVFFVNVPIGIALLAASMRLLPPRSAPAGAAWTFPAR